MVTDNLREVMAGTGKKDGIIKYKLAYTVLIILCYLFGREVPLYGIDVSVYLERNLDAEALLIQTISGDLNRCSLFALGISPYITASVLVQIFSACGSIGSRRRTPPGKLNRITLLLMMGFAFFQAIVRVQEISFKTMEAALLPVKFIAVTEMMTGVVLIIWMAERNKKYGIGGQTVFICINILDGMAANAKGHGAGELLLPLSIAFGVMIIILVMENSEKRIPVQRISIHNIYADKNYLAVKLNPVGVMPVMFSTAFFMLPQLAVTGLCGLFPDNSGLVWWQENLVLSRVTGVCIYIGLLYVLTIVFALIFISPGVITEQLLKSGDSIANLHAGCETKRYLVGTVCRISLLSATVMGICLGIPMVLQLKGIVESSLVMIPSSAMMLTGIWHNLREEFLTIRSYDMYKSFI